MYPTYELALQRQAEIRTGAAQQRMSRQARSAPRPTRSRSLTAWTRPFRLTATDSRPAQA